MTTELDDLPEFLKLTSEQRKMGWIRWDKEHPVQVRPSFKRDETKPSPKKEGKS